MTVGKLWSVTLDCTDPKPLADFWAAMLGGSIAYESDEFIGVQTTDGLWVGAYHVDDYRPAAWPDGEVGKQFHLDVTVDDLDTAEGEAVALGATKAERQPRPESWRVLLDPAGHPFCVTDASV